MKLKHPASGQTIDVDAERADIYLSQGWEKAPAKKAAAPGARKAAAKKPADKPAE